MTPPTLCRGCGAPIRWVKTPRGRWMPLDPDGKPHWATCPQAKLFKPGGPYQEAKRREAP